jgi:thymidylate synthase (FAD)
MKVKLVAITKPLEEGINTAQEFISFCARVSAPNNQYNTKTASGLLKYCVNHKHFSIFEMGNMVFEIETTRDISRQILRHRSRLGMIQ